MRRVSYAEAPLLWDDDAGPENLNYLTKQLITCIGNKRILLSHLDVAVHKVKTRLGKQKLRLFDAFSGSGVVSRSFKQHASLLVSNDLEPYAAASGRCFLSNRNSVDDTFLQELIVYLNESVDRLNIEQGFIERLYSPYDEMRITAQDRVFYTKKNARRLDNYRRLLDGIDDPKYRDFVLGPLLSEASIHTNTAGVFKGFYKDSLTKIGKFGGSNGDALSRIKGEIKLSMPTFSRFDCEVEVHQKNVNDLVPYLPAFDLVYLDPPYNQHPYGSNYFMLNLLTNYIEPKELSRVAGIPTDWQRSDYNVRSKCLARLTDLVEKINAPFILVSFNNEGFISPAEMREMLSRFGKLETIDVPYNAFRGSRNFDNRSIHVTEHLFMIERS